MVKTSWAINQSENFTISIAGTKGGLQLPPVKLITNQGRFQVEVSPKILADRDVAFAGHYGLTANVVRTLRGEEEALIKKDEVLNVVRAIDALYRSAELGCEVAAD